MTSILLVIWKYYRIMSNHLIRTLSLILRQQSRPLWSYVPNSTRVLSKYITQEAGYRSITDSCVQSSPISSDVQREVEHHSKLANEWWDVNGPLKALHSLNEIRVPFIRDGLIARGHIYPDLLQTTNVLLNQTILEVGCGGGILTEQMARLGASVTALDLGENLIQVAREHLSQEASPNLCDRIQYKIEPVELHAKEKQNFYDAVVISEVLEHIDDKVSFLTASVQCLKPGGSIFITTLNKTLAMFVGGVLIGEYVIKAAPVGTHHYEKMISPLDVQRILDTMGCHTVLVNGSIYDFWCNKWRWINSDNMCYALQAVKTEI